MIPITMTKRQLKALRWYYEKYPSRWPSYKHDFNWFEEMVKSYRFTFWLSVVFVAVGAGLFLGFLWMFAYNQFKTNLIEEGIVWSDQMRLARHILKGEVS